MQNTDLNVPASITIADISVNIPTINNESVNIGLPDGSTCIVRKIGNLLVIETGSTADLKIAGNLRDDFETVSIRAAGNVDFAANGKELHALLINNAHEATKELRGTIAINSALKLDKINLIAKTVELNKDCTANHLEISAQKFEQAETSKLHIDSIDSNKSKIVADEVYLKGVSSGYNLFVHGFNNIHIAGKLSIEGLILTASRVLFKTGAEVDGLNKLTINADWILALGRVIAVNADIKAWHMFTLLNGSVQGLETLSINAFTNTIALGARLRGTNVLVQAGLAFNFLGIVRAFNYCTESLFNADIGLTLPERPHNMASITNTQKLLVAVRLVAKNVYAPIGTLLTLALKAYSIVKGLSKLHERYQNHQTIAAKSYKDAHLNILNAALNLRSIYYANNDFHDAHASLKTQGVLTDRSGLNTLFPEPAPSMRTILTGFLHHAPVAIWPAYVRDCTDAVYDRGVVITGAKALVPDAKTDDRSTVVTIYPPRY